LIYHIGLFGSPFDDIYNIDFSMMYSVFIAFVHGYIHFN
jgi:hypothetical protein